MILGNRNLNPVLKSDCWVHQMTKKTLISSCPKLKNRPFTDLMILSLVLYICRMITAVSWIPKGNLKAVPDVAEPPSKEELKELIESGAFARR